MFGDIVRGHRRRLSLSQQEVADKSGVSVRGLRKLESGQVTTPRPVTVRLLAEVFGLIGAARDQFFAAVHAQPERAPDRASGPLAQRPATIARFVGRTGEPGLLDAVVAADE